MGQPLPPTTALCVTLAPAKQRSNTSAAFDLPAPYAQLPGPPPVELICQAPAATKLLVNTKLEILGPSAFAPTVNRTLGANPVL